MCTAQCPIKELEPLRPTQHILYFARYWLLQIHHLRNAATQRMLTWRVRNPWLREINFTSPCSAWLKLRDTSWKHHLLHQHEMLREGWYFQVKCKIKTHWKQTLILEANNKTHKNQEKGLAGRNAAKTPCHQECPWQQVNCMAGCVYILLPPARRDQGKPYGLDYDYKH